MVKFSFMYYFILVMSFLIMTVFLCGVFTYKKTNTKIKFLNRPLFISVLSIGVIAFVLSWIPIFLKVWEMNDDDLKSSGLFISLLVLELLFVIGFLALSYVFAYDFGIALNKDEKKLQFFIEVVNTDNIVELEEKKHSLKIVFNRGKKMKKKLTVFTPKAKIFVREILSEIIKVNQAALASQTEVEDMTTKKLNAAEVNTESINDIAVNQKIDNMIAEADVENIETTEKNS